MNRRSFVRNAAGAAALLSVAPSVLLTGCTVDITGLINDVITAGERILRVAEPNAPWLGQLIAALNALTGAELTWKSGGAVQVIEEALATVQDVLAVIPLTAQYSGLIDVLVAGIDAVLEAFSAQKKPGVAASPTMMAHAAVQNPHRGRVALRKPGLLQSHSQAFRAQFKSTAQAAGLPQAAF